MSADSCETAARAASASARAASAACLSRSVSTSRASQVCSVSIATLRAFFAMSNRCPMLWALLLLLLPDALGAAAARCSGRFWLSNLSTCARIACSVSSGKLHLMASSSVSWASCNGVCWVTCWRR